MPLGITKSWLVLSLLSALGMPAQQVLLTGLDAIGGQGAFHGLRQDVAGNLYTVMDARDGLRVLKFNAAGTQLLAQAHLGQAGDAGIALDVDAAGNVYVVGTSLSSGSITGTGGTAFPARADSTTNSFVAKFDTTLTEQWLTFCGSGQTAVAGVAVTATQVLVTGSIFKGALPVTTGGIQQAPAPNSSGNGFAESFSTSTGSLQYATYLTGANGTTAATAIATDNLGDAYIVGTTTATGYPTTAALVPVFRAPAGSNVSGFLTELTPAGDSFVFSTFVPGGGLNSVAVTASSIFFSGNVAPGLFPITVAQQPIAPLLSYQTAVRLSLDGSAVQSATLLSPGTESVLTASTSGTAWAWQTTLNSPLVPLLPVPAVETLGNAAALRITSTGDVDRVTRIGGVPVSNTAYASLPVTEGGVVIAADGSVALTGSIAPTLSSSLLATDHYDLPLTNAPNTALPSTVRDALPPATCSGSLCAGGAGLLARLQPDATAAALSLSSDDLPNLILRNPGTAAATGLQVTATGYTVTSGCGTSLPPGGECPIQLSGTGPGSITVGASNVALFTTQLPTATQPARPIQVTPHELDFGIQTSGSTTGTRTLTVANLGSTPQTFVSQALNAGTTAYTLAEAASTCTPAGDGISKTLAAHSSCTVTLGLAAGASSTGDGAVNTHWQVGSTEVLVTGYAQVAATSLSATTVDFGRQYTGGLRIPRYLYLSNSSDTAQSHATVSSNNSAFTVTDECPATLQPRSVCRIALGYNAATTPSSDAMTLTVDGLTATVLGETLPQPSINGASTNPNLGVSPTAIAFANPVTVTAISAETHAVNISNTSATGFAVNLAVSGDFTFTTNCPATLAGGTACSATVFFTPSAAGLRQGLLAVTAGSSAPVYVELSGTGTAILPAINGAVSFGDVPLNTLSVQWLKVSQSFVSLTAASSDPAFKAVLVEDLGFGHGDPVPSNFSSTVTGSCLNCYLGVQFLPTVVGADAAAISLTSPGGGAATTIPVTGNGAPLTGLILTPVSADFGTVPVHSSSAATIFQLTNGTSAAIAATGASATGDFATTAQITGGAPCTGASVAPGASCFVPVTFTPAATGTRTGQLTVATSAGTATSSLSGTGSDDPGIALATTSISFDNVPGTAATQATLTVTNTGSIPAQVGSPTLSDSHFTANSACGTLAPAGSCNITVNYAPTASLAAGTLTLPVTLSPAGAAITTTYAVALNGTYTSESAGLQIIPGEHTTVNFGSAATDLPSISRVLHVNNLTVQSLTLQTDAPREFAVTASTCATLAAGGSCDLTIEYTPLTAGDTTGTVLLTGTPSGGGAAVSGLGYLQGYGIGNGTLDLTGNLSPLGTLDFGQVASGLSATQTLTLTNPITAAAGTVITVRRVLSEFPYFSTTSCGAPLTPGQSCTVIVTYAPIYQVATGSGTTTSQSNSGTLTIESDAANAPQFIDITGSASAALVSAPDNTGPIASITIDQGSLTFPSTAVGSASAAQTVAITNTGTRAVTILGLVTSAGFSATGNCGAIAAGAACNVSVTFQPQAAGTALGSLEIQTDGSSALEFVSLLGQAVAASVSLTPQSLDFGTVLVGRTSTLTATLSNNGGTAITLGATAVTGAGFSAGPAAANACPATGGTLAAGASCTFAVAFKPAITGTLRGILSVATSATAVPLTVSLSGVGSQPQLAISPASLNFGTVAVGSSATLSLTLRNGSTLPVSNITFAAPAPFTVSNTCGIFTLTAGSSCSVSVTYTPTAASSSTGTLTIASSDPASPLTVPLTGNATQGGSFTLSITSGSTVSVQSGLPANFTLAVTPTGGYSGTVALTCTPDTSVPYAACSLLPPTFTLSGSAAQTSTATVNTISAVSSAKTLEWVALGIAPLALLLTGRRRRCIAPLLGLLLAVGMLSGGCGGGGDVRVRYVAAGTYTFHVTATSTNSIPVQQSVVLTVVVTPN